MYATVCDLLGQLDEYQQPDLDISQGLQRLAPLPCIAPNASHILANAVNRFHAIVPH